jgi:hypothetical protein
MYREINREDLKEIKGGNSAFTSAGKFVGRLIYYFCVGASRLKG